MDLQTLRTFATVAEELHFGRAAARLHLAQQAVSQQVKRLERDLDAQLLRRTTRRVELTQAGAALQTEAKGILEHVDDTRRRVRALALGEAGTCRIAYDSVTVGTVLPRAVRACDRELPGVDIRLEEMCSGDIRRRLLTGGIDVGLAGPAIDLVGLEHATLTSDRPVLIVPDTHPLAVVADEGESGAERVNLRDLADEHFISYDPDATGGACELVDRLLADAGVEPNIVHNATSEQAVLGLVAAGCGIGIVSGHAADATALPVHAFDVEPTMALDSRVVWVAGRSERAVERVVDAVVSAR